MSKEMMNVCEFVLDTAQKAGADECRVSFSKRRFVEVQYREHKPETVKEATTQGLGVDIYVNGRYSSQSSADLRKDALKTFVINVIETAKLLEEDPYRSLPDPKYYQGRKNIDLQLFDPGYKSITPERRHSMAKELENACFAAGGDKVISVTSQVYDEFQEETTLTSNGFSGQTESTVTFAFAEMTAQDKGDRRPNGYEYAIERSMSQLPSCEVIGRKAAERTLELMDSEKLKTETLPIIIENRGAGRVLSGFVSAMNGWALQQKRSFLLDKKGEKMGSKVFTLIDDPFVIGGLGSRLYDGDGFATQKRIMVENGILKDYYIDWYRSRKLAVEPTTGGTSNLILPPGKRSVEAIMKDLGRGILINGFIGGNSNSNTGDFSVGITGTLFENGELTQAVAEMNIADNHLEFWNKLAEAANDPWTYGNWHMPSLVFTDVVVSGV
ncbi:TldD/PmbA family protein [candidate division KSB1 bacterium]|nr:TldD/PmbA family protein [candidate division KSB1 bacterium]RQW00706.1 MAG: TldD/PmbA family protein [candidate division KSB1 bacterium]